MERVTNRLSAFITAPMRRRLARPAGPRADSSANRVTNRRRPPDQTSLKTRCNRSGRRRLRPRSRAAVPTGFTRAERGTGVRSRRMPPRCSRSETVRDSLASTGNRSGFSIATAERSPGSGRPAVLPVYTATFAPGTYPVSFPSHRKCTPSGTLAGASGDTFPAGSIEKGWVD